MMFWLYSNVLPTHTKNIEKENIIYKNSLFLKKPTKMGGITHTGVPKYGFQILVKKNMVGGLICGRIWYTTYPSIQIL